MSDKMKRMLSIQNLTIVALVVMFSIMALSESKVVFVSAKDSAKAFDQQVKMLEQNKLLPAMADIASLKKAAMRTSGNFILVLDNGVLSVKTLTEPLSENEAMTYGFYHPDRMLGKYLILADGRYMMRDQLGRLRIITNVPQNRKPLSIL